MCVFRLRSPSALDFLCSTQETMRLAEQKLKERDASHDYKLDALPTQLPSGRCVCLSVYLSACLLFCLSFSSSPEAQSNGVSSGILQRISRKQRGNEFSSMQESTQ